MVIKSGATLCGTPSQAMREPVCANGLRNGRAVPASQEPGV